MTKIVVIALVVVTSLAGWLRLTARRAFLRDRNPESGEWSTRYASEQLPIVMSALRAIRDAFLLSKGDELLLRADDKLIDLYRSAYPHGGADTMEFEHLVLTLTEDFGIPEAELKSLDTATISDVVWLCITYAGRPR